MSGDHAAVLDACVLVPAALRDTLLRLAETPPLYVPRWSDTIIGEVQRTLQRKLGKSAEQVNHLEAQLRNAFPEAWVTGYERFEATLTNHRKDRHVLAAAIRSSAQVIVTFNLKHFPAEATRPYRVGALHPDDFLVNLFRLDDTIVVTRFREQAAAIGRTVEEQLQAIERTRVLPSFSQVLADALRIKL